MKQFNLEQALQGRPVVTREGKVVTQLKFFEVTKSYSLAGIIDGDLHMWCADGRYYKNGYENPNDLFMKEEELYVFIHPDQLSNECINVSVYKSTAKKFSYSEATECYKLVKV